MITENVLDSEDIYKITNEIVEREENEDDQTNNKIFGLVIGLLCSHEGDTEGWNQEHVKQLIERLDSDDSFHGVPFCLVNEHGSSVEARALCKQEMAKWNIVKQSKESSIDRPVDDVFRFHICKDAEAARIIMMTFIEKVTLGSSEASKKDSANSEEEGKHHEEQADHHIP